MEKNPTRSNYLRLQILLCVDRTFSRPFCPNLRFCFARVVMCRLTLRAALVRCGPGALDAYDALGAHAEQACVDVTQLFSLLFFVDVFV